MRFFARPYVAGDSVEAGLACAADLLAREGSLATMDLLAEGATRPEQVRANAAVYARLIEAIASDPRFPDPAVRPSVSVKPSAFTTGPVDDARAPLEGIAELARDRGVALTLDMEERRWTDFTLALAVALYESGHDVGAVLQTRLHRTQADLARVPEGMRLRLVIGIYPEPEEFAIQDKRVMKERMLEYAASLLERGVRVEFATHDEEYLRRFLRECARPGCCELQMLLGVPRDRFLRRLRAGEFGPVLPLRRYVPFAVSWDDATAYLRRRMAESPSMVWLVLRNLRPAQRS